VDDVGVVAADGATDSDGAALAGSSLLFLCTGNAARSVMAGFMCGWLAESEGHALRIATAGTHVAEGQPMSMRTRAALATIPELADVPVHRHRGHQLVDADLDRTDLVVAMEADHVRYVRRRHPRAAAKTATLRRLCRDLGPGPAPLTTRVSLLSLASAEVGHDEDVSDPAGGDDEDYIACAAELWRLCQELVGRL
jgi:protein-tyrosine-phosphatase